MHPRDDLHCTAKLVDGSQCGGTRWVRNNQCWLHREVGHVSGSFLSAENTDEELLQDYECGATQEDNSVCRVAVFFRGKRCATHGGPIAKSVSTSDSMCAENTARATSRELKRIRCGFYSASTQKYCRSTSVAGLSRCSSHLEARFNVRHCFWSVLVAFS